MQRPMLCLAATLTLLRLVISPVPVLADHEVTVADGDTLSTLALMWYGDANYAQQIAGYNGLADADDLTVGQVLRLPDIAGTPEAPASLQGGAANGSGGAPSAPPSAPVIQMGLATWYGQDFEGQVTKCGQVYHQADYTASSNDLPCGTVISVTNVHNGRSVTVTVDDTGAFSHPTILDLSPAAFGALATLDTGVLRVSVSNAAPRNTTVLTPPSSPKPMR
jgi:rare lipoprotein A (peptidoglycan hydrolase)